MREIVILWRIAYETDFHREYQKKVRHLENIEIPVPKDMCRHIILTGKTSVLDAMVVWFEKFEDLLKQVFDDPSVQLTFDEEAI